MTSIAFSPSDLSPRLRRVYDTLPESERQALATRINRERGFVPEGISLALLVALSWLTDAEREVWVDSEIVGLTYRAIAEDRECSHANVGLIKQRAQRKMNVYMRRAVLRLGHVASHPDVKARA